MRRSSRGAGLLALLLVLILCIAAAARFYQLGGQSLWADEGNSAAMATRSLALIARDAANDIHPPLYYWLLHLWTGIFGYTEVALRSLSAVFGVLLVLTIAELGRRLYSSITGLLAGLIAAIAPFQVYYSQEARMYILLALEAAVAMLLFWWLLSQEDHRLPYEPVPSEPLPSEPLPGVTDGQKGKAPGGATPPGSAPPGAARARIRWLPFSGQLLVVTWTAGLYTHYAFPLIIALSTGIYALWLIATRTRGCVGPRIIRWGIFLGITLGLYAPWLGTAVNQLTAWPAPNAATGLLEQIRALLATVAFGPAASPELLPWVVPLFVIALLGAAPWPFLTRDQQAGGPSMDWLRCLLPLAWMLAPILMILALGLFRGAYLKFLLIGSPAFSLLLARGITGPVGWAMLTPLLNPSQGEGGRVRESLRDAIAVIWVVAALAVVFASAGALLARYWNEPSASRDDYRGMTQFVMATAQPNDAILLDAPGQGEVFEYYYKGELPVYALPKQRPIDVQQTEAGLQRLLTHGKVYALYWATGEADPEGVIQRWLDQRGYKTIDQWHGNVRLAVYVMPERRAPEEAASDLNARFDSGISLDGYQGWNLAPAAGEVTQVQLQWRAAEKPARRYKVFLQLLDARNQVIAQRDAEPAGESRPTTSWLPGETVLDNHGMLIPPGTPPGSYRRIVGLYDAETGDRAKLADGSDFVSLPPITVQRSKTPPQLDALNMQNRQQFDFGAISLLGDDRHRRGFGHAPGTPIKPGDLLHLTFYWKSNAAPRADWWFELSLTDHDGQSVAKLNAPLVSDTYPTTMWQKDEIVRGEHDLQIPADLAPGTYRLSLTPSPDRDTPAGSAYLGTVRVQAGE